MSRLILVDAMNMAYRMAYVPNFQSLCTKSNIPTGVIHGFLTSLFSYAIATDKIIIAWDCYSQRKRDLYPNYKIKRQEKDAIRKAIDEEIQKQIITLKRILKLMAIEQYSAKGYEADEVIADLVVRSKIEEVVILSEDKDFLQLVNKKISVWQPIRQREIHINNFAKHYLDLTPKEYFYYRQLTGDVSDCIEGVPGCGEKTALEILEGYRNEYTVRENKNTLSAYLSYSDSFGNGKLEKKLLAKMSVESIINIIERNRKLMILPSDVPIEELYKELHQLNYERLEKLLSVLELRQILRIWRRRCL